MLVVPCIATNSLYLLCDFTLQMAVSLQSLKRFGVKTHCCVSVLVGGEDRTQSPLG